MKTLKRFLGMLGLVTAFIGGGAAIILAGVASVALGVKVGGLFGGAAGLIIYLILFISIVLTVCTGD